MARHIWIGERCFQFDLANITVEPVLFLYMFTNFLYFPILQALIFNKVCIQKYTPSFCEALQHNDTFKEGHKIQNHNITSETSFWILKTTIALTVSSFVIVILFLGALGDKYGRKFPVVLPCVGAFAAYQSGLLNAKYMSASLYYILIGPIINGLCGGYIACLMAVYSYVGHIASPTSKMTRIGILESMVFLAGTLGVFVSGLMLDNLGYVYTFSVISVIIGLAFLYAVIWLDNVRSPSSLNARESCGRMMGKFFRESFQCVMKQRDDHTFAVLVLQVIALDVLMLCTSGDMDISLLYLKEKLNFSQTLFGYLRGLDNFCRGLIMITFVPLIKYMSRVKDLPLVMLGLLSYAASFVLVGIATTKWMVFVAAVIGMFKGIPSAGLRATMSTLVSTDEQGRLFGLIAASESVISILASVVFNELYPATYDIYPGFCYILGAGLLLLTFAVIMFLHCSLLRISAEPDYQTLEEEIREANNEDLLTSPTGAV